MMSASVEKNERLPLRWLCYNPMGSFKNSLFKSVFSCILCTMLPCPDFGEYYTVTIQQCPRCKEDACEVCCLHISRPMTQQMGCCWIISIYLGGKAIQADDAADGVLLDSYKNIKCES